MTTYEMIRALPAKGFNWTGFSAALRTEWVALQGRNIASWSAQNTLQRWDTARGMREVRTAAMEMANFIVSDKSRRVSRIAPSSESRMWDSFEGGHTDVWTDAGAEAAATQEIAELIKCYRK
jgi:hypothetical protein